MRNITLFLATVALAIGTASAAVVGSQGFSDNGSLFGPATDTGDINTASKFFVGSLSSNFGFGSQTGDFLFMPSHTVANDLTIDTTIPGSFSFSDAVFGDFSSTSISIASNVPGAVAIYILGTYSSGTWISANHPADITAGEIASFTFTFNQNPAHTGALSDSATFSDPPATPPGTPEPATMGLFGSAFVGLGLLGRKKLAKK